MWWINRANPSPGGQRAISQTLRQSIRDEMLKPETGLTVGESHPRRGSRIKQRVLSPPGMGQKIRKR